MEYLIAGYALPSTDFELLEGDYCAKCDKLLRERDLHYAMQSRLCKSCFLERKVKGE